MFGFLGPVSKPRGHPTADDHDLLSFEPRKVVLGIEFHLLDSKVASAVSGESREATLDRITRDPGRLTIRRDRWADMNDAQRLHWLLERSHTAVRFDRNAVAVLIGKR